MINMECGSCGTDRYLNYDFCVVCRWQFPPSNDDSHVVNFSFAMSMDFADKTNESMTVVYLVAKCDQCADFVMQLPYMNDEKKVDIMQSVVALTAMISKKSEIKHRPDIGKILTEIEG